jgi:hypothetical protein
MHARTTPPHKPRLAGLVLFLDELEGMIGGIVIQVSMRFLVSGPVSSIFWVPSGSAQEWITPLDYYIYCLFSQGVQGLAGIDGLGSLRLVDGIVAFLHVLLHDRLGGLLLVHRFHGLLGINRLTQFLIIDRVSYSGHTQGKAGYNNEMTHDETP